MRSLIRFRRGVLLVAMLALVVGVVAVALQPAIGTAHPVSTHVATAAP